MPFRLMCGAAALPLLLSVQHARAEESGPPALTDTIVVTGHRATSAETAATDPVDGHATAPDAAALVAKLPGAALINNGAISGQVQYRGLFSDRLSIRVGGQSFQTGGPNAMDPPLHYAPAILLESISLTRGAAPVSAGPGLGAQVDARLKAVDFGTTAELAPVASLAASYRSADDGAALGVFSGMGLMKSAQLAPDAILLPANFDAYRHYSHLFKATVASIAPKIEDRGIDEIYIDFSDFPEDTFHLAQRIKQAVFAATLLNTSLAREDN